MLMKVTLSIMAGAAMLCAQAANPAVPGEPTSAPVAKIKRARGPGAVVITVGPNKIQKKQIDTLVSLMVKSKKTIEPDPREKAALEKMIATNLIGQELLDLEAKRLNVKAEEKDIDSMFRYFRGNFPDAATFSLALKEAGDTEASLKNKLARQIKADKILSGQVQKVERPTDKEMQDFYAQHKAMFPVSDSLRACQIVLIVNADTKPSQATEMKAALEKAREELSKDSADVDALLTRFLVAARQMSQGPEGKDGGDLQRFKPTDMKAEFQKNVVKLKVGQMSQVFRTPLGWHLVLLTERYDGKFESYRLQVARLVVAEKASQTAKNLKKYLQTLAGRYPIKYLEQAYRDTSSAGVYNL